MSINFHLKSKQPINTQAVLSTKSSNPEEMPVQMNRYYEMTQAKKVSYRDGILPVRLDVTLPAKSKFAKTEAQKASTSQPPADSVKPYRTAAHKRKNSSHSALVPET